MADTQVPAAQQNEPLPVSPAAVPAGYQQYAQPAQPVVPSTPAGASGQLDVNQFKEEILQAVGTLLQERQGQHAQAAPAGQPTAVAGEALDWLKLLSEGKRAEGEAALKKMLAVPNAQDIKNEAVSEMQANYDIQSYTHQVRTDPANAEVLRLEPLIGAAVQVRMAKLNPQTPADRVKVFKEAVDIELANARKLVLTFRGEGASAAQVRQTQVLAQPTLQPSTVQRPGDQPTQQGEQVQSPQDYFAARSAETARLKRLTA